ncbi:hypothetical protein ACIPSA_28625 [Streptomyces sp. NPDC086549]|uniref:hypothetical protein n=1 Tax=Streptomyces sp. NPDC086549 TaxID=3365752 RepID=UPI00380665F5
MHEPDRGRDSGDGPAEPIPPIPSHSPQAAAQWEVIAGPGQDREPGPPLRVRWRRQSARTRAVTVAVTFVALALGGTVAYAAGSGGSGGHVVPAAAGTSSTSPSPDGHGHGPGFGWFFGLGGGGVHGEATVKDRGTGKWIVRAWQRGTVEKVDGDQVTVKSDDGARWTWTVGSDTRVLADGSSHSGAAALKKGDTAFVAGTRAGDGTRTAKIAVSGVFEHMGMGMGMGMGGQGDDRGRFPDRGPWGHSDRTASPSPSDSGATT